ncbi:sgo-1 [Pristionchus pacificus]|uniref:Sgo-1 n=1 Tax=Pristionchus pacificus TaxID=54126 RepID=A0A2A6BWL8_PRIPA|nr:sgo-1 [Pristionchus pacificus]|eukprot:PDM70161.1 sgo-1 [Pristionchus pacificus]
MGDNKPISKSDLRSLFGSLLGGSSSASTSSTSRDAAPGAELSSGEDYKKSNNTLVIRNCQLKSELSKIKKEMDSLRFENESLRDRLRQMESSTEDERIEMIVSQRVESRVKQIKFMVDRSVKFLQKTSDDLSGVFGGIDEQQENNSNTMNDRKSTQPLARKPALAREDRLRKTTSSSASDRERKGKGDADKTVKSEDKATNEEMSKEVQDKVANDDNSKEETERAVGGRDKNTVQGTVADTILYETPKRASIVDAVESINEDNDGVETARSTEENGGTPILMNNITQDITPVLNDEFGEEDDVVGEIPISSYDMRPIRPLPTPLRKVDITPTRRIEMFCDERGRVKRNEKIMRYMDDKRKSYDNNIN